MFFSCAAFLFGIFPCSAGDPANDVCLLQTSFLQRRANLTLDDFEMVPKVMGTPPDASAAPATASTAQGRPGAKNWWAWARLDYPFPGCSAARPCFNGDCVDGNCVCDIGWRQKGKRLEVLPQFVAALPLPPVPPLPQAMKKFP